MPGSVELGVIGVIGVIGPGVEGNSELENNEPPGVGGGFRICLLGIDGAGMDGIEPVWTEGKDQKSQ